MLGSVLPGAQSPVPVNEASFIVEGVCASKSLQLDTLPVQRNRAGCNSGKQKGRRRRYFEEEAMIYCTINSPGITGLAQTWWEQRSSLAAMLPGNATSV